MRIRTDGRFAYREDVLDDNADLWDCNKTDAVLESCEFTREMLGRRGALREALDHPDMTPELAEILSTKAVELEVRRETEFHIDT